MIRPTVVFDQGDAGSEVWEGEDGLVDGSGPASVMVYGLDISHTLELTFDPIESDVLFVVESPDKADATWGIVLKDSSSNILYDGLLSDIPVEGLSLAVDTSTVFKIDLIAERLDGNDAELTLSSVHFAAPESAGYARTLVSTKPLRRFGGWRERSIVMPVAAE